MKEAQSVDDLTRYPDTPEGDQATVRTSNADVVPLHVQPKRRGPPKGSPKPAGSGRQKGTPNKINSSIHEIMASMKCDPRTILARIAMNAKNPPDLRRKAATDLMGFMFPRLAAQEITGANGAPLMGSSIQVQDMLPLEVQQRMAAILQRAKGQGANGGATKLTRDADTQDDGPSTEGADAAT
jgi:hypothetical protein